MVRPPIQIMFMWSSSTPCRAEKWSCTSPARTPGILLCTDRRPDAAAADCHAALHRSRRHGLSERDDEVRIIVSRVQAMRPEIDDLVPGRAQAESANLFLQTKPTMIRCNSHAHVILLACIQLLAVLLPRGRASSTGLLAANPPGGNRYIAVAQATEHFHFLSSSHDPKYPPRRD